MHQTAEHKKTPATFHNTVKAQGELLFEYKGRAEAKQTKIYYHLKNNPGKQYSPHELQAELFPKESVDLVVSTRRSLTNLQIAGWIKKTDDLFPGLHGVDTHKWFYL